MAPESTLRMSSSDGASKLVRERNRLKFAACLVVLVALAADYLLLTIVVPIMPDLLAPQVMSSLQLSVLFASKSILQVMSNPIVGRIVDARGGRRIMFAGIVLAILATAAFTIGDQFWQLLVARSVQGIGSSLTVTGGMAFLSTIHRPSERGAAIGMAMNGIALGVVAGPALGGGLTAWLGRDAPFLFVGGVLALAGVAQIVLHIFEARIGLPAVVGSSEEGDEADNAGCKQQAKLYSDPYAIGLAVAVATTNAANAMQEPVVPKFLQDTYGMSAGVRGLLYSATPAAYLLVTPLVGCLANRDIKARLMFVGMLLAGVALPLMFVLQTAGWSTQPYSAIPKPAGIAAIVAMLALVGVGNSFIDVPAVPLITSILEFRRLSAYGSAVAVVDSATNIGFVVGPLIGGALVTAIDTQRALAVFGVVNLVLAPILCGHMSAERRFSAANGKNRDNTSLADPNTQSQPLLSTVSE